MDGMTTKSAPSRGLNPSWLFLLVGALAVLSILPTLAPVAQAAGPVVTATKTDTVFGAGNGKADAGDTVRYTIVVSNTGDTAAQGVVFTDTIDANTHLSGTVKSTPLAFDDAYDVIGNTAIEIPAASGLMRLAGDPVRDRDPDGDLIHVGVYSTTSTLGGTVFVTTTTGAFRYTPPVGLTGTDTFWYTLVDSDGNVDRGKVTVTIRGMVWYIDNYYSGAVADGRQTTPFKSVNDYNAARTDPISPTDNPKAGSVIYILRNTLTTYYYLSALTLLADQTLLGQGVDLSVPGVITPVLGSVLPTRGISPTLDSDAGGIVLNSNNTVRGLTLTQAGGSGISGSNINKAVIRDVSIQISSAEGISLIGVQGAVTLSDLFVAGSKGRNVLIQASSGSATVTVSNGAFQDTDSLFGADGFELLAHGTSSVSFTASGSTFSGNQTTGLQAHAEDSGVLTLNVSGCTFQNNDVGIDAGAGSTGGTSSATLNITGNTFDGHTNHTINLFSSGSGHMTGRILNNTITQPPGATGPGIRVDVDGNSTGTIRINGNTVTVQNAENAPAIDVLTRSGTSSATNLQLTLTGNTVHTTGPIGIQVRSMNVNGICANITGNTSVSTYGSTPLGYRLRLLDTSSFALEGFSGDGSNAATVASFVNTNNPGSTAASVTIAPSRAFSAASCQVASLLTPGGVYFTERSGGALSTAVVRSEPAQETPLMGRPARVGGWASPLHADMSPFTIGTLPAGKTITLTFNVTVTNPLPPDAVRLSNQGRISGLNFAAVLTDDPSTLAPNDATLTPLNLVADLQISKSDDQASAVPGRVVTYTITITNPGPSHVVGAVVSDTVPQNLVGATWTCAASGGGTCSASGTGRISDTVNLPKDVVLTYLLSGTIASGATGRLTNTAAVTVPVEVVDLTPGNNVASDGDALTPQADLGIQKDDKQTTAVPGLPLTYRVVVSNAGPSDAIDATVVDTLPPALGGVAWTCVGSAGGACLAGGAGDINDTTVRLPGGAVVTYTITGTVNAGAIISLTNTATVTVPVGVTDLTSGNNTATDTDTLTPEADLSISKSDGQDSVVPGTPIVYRVVVSNTGPSNAPGVTIADVLPAVLTGSIWSCIGAGGGSCSATGAGDIHDSAVDLPSGAVVTYTITGTVAAGATGSLVNGVTATVPAGVTELTPGNNSATDTGTLTPQADLSINKSDGQDVAVPGMPLTYRVVVSNTGPSDATGATVVDVLPATLTGAVWTCAGAGGATCPAGGVGSINDSTVSLPSGATVTYTITGTVAAGATGSLVNDATVAAPGGVTELNAGNNRAVDTDALTPQTELGINKDDAQTTAVPGVQLTYHVVVSNAGPSNAPGVTVSDTLPAALSDAVWTCAGSDGGTCSAGGSGSINDTTVNLPVRSAITYTITGTVTAGASGNLANTATVAPPAGATDPTPNGSSTDTDVLTPQVDLSILKDDGQITAVPGLPLTYRVVVSNTGPSDAIGATVVDTLPSALGEVMWTCAGSAGGACLAGGAGDINEATVRLPSGAVVTYTITGTVKAGAVGSLTNIATVTVPVGLTELTSGDNTATDSDTLTPRADLSASISDGQSTAVPGLPLTYQVIVSNTGPSDATGAAVTATFPSSFGGVTWTCSGSDGSSCAAGGAGDVSDVMVHLPVGGAVTYTITGLVSSGVTGTLTASATVAAPLGTTDPALANNQSTDSDVLTPQADLQVSKDDGQSAAVPGRSLAYQVVVTNAGPSDVIGAHLVDHLPGVLNGATWTCTGAGGGTCALSGVGDINDISVSLPRGGAATYVLTASVAASASGSLVNAATVITPPGVSETLEANNSATDTDVLTAEADLGISKDDGQTSAVPGLPITYTIAVSNAGPSDIGGAAVTDILSTAFADASWTCVGSDGGTCASGGGPGAIHDSPVVLPVGAWLTYTLQATVAPGARGVLSNTADVTTPVNARDPISANNRSTDADSLSPLVDLTVEQTSSADPVVAGSGVGNLTYFITVTNDGPSDATAVAVTETLTLPDGVVVETAVPSAGSLSGPLWAVGNLPVGHGAVLTVVLTVGPQTAAGADLIGSKAEVGAVAEPLVEGSQPATVRTSVERQVDLEITQSSAPGVALPGDPVSFRLSYVNHGPSLASGVVITDQVPVTLTNPAVQSDGAAITLTGGSSYVWDVADLMPGSGGTITLTGQVDPALTTSTVLTNTALIGAAEKDSDESNNRASAAVSVPIADLALTKTVSSAAVGQGVLVTYTLTLHNDSATEAAGVTVSDTLPTGLTGVGSLATSGSLIGDLWTLGGPLPGGGTATLEIMATANAGTAGRTLTNTAEILSAGPFDPVKANNQSSAPIRVLAANLAIEKSGPITATPGLTAAYIITVSNAGPDEAQNVVVSDTLPAEIAGATWSCTTAGGATCEGAGSGDVHDVANLPLGSRITYQISATVRSAATSTVVNRAAAVAPGGIDPDTSNNEAQATTTLEPSADLYITKSVTRDHSTPVVNYTVVVGNRGPSDAPGTVVSDTRPARVTSFDWTCQGGGGGTCAGGSGSGSIFQTVQLPVGTVLTYAVTANLPDITTSVGNTATVAAPAGVVDFALADNQASVQSSGGRAYLPIIRKGDMVAPDLVIESLTATSQGITVTVRNNGSGEVHDAFWMDVSFNPTTRPPRINQPWNTIATRGAAWGVTTPIPAGGRLTLTTRPTDPFYFPGNSSASPWPVGASVYAYVDSVNFSTTYGAVLESNESNNAFGPAISMAGQGTTSTSVAASPSAAGLPRR